MRAHPCPPSAQLFGQRGLCVRNGIGKREACSLEKKKRQRDPKAYLLAMKQALFAYTRDVKHEKTEFQKHKAQIDLKLARNLEALDMDDEATPEARDELQRHVHALFAAAYDEHQQQHHERLEQLQQAHEEKMRLLCRTL